MIVAFDTETHLIAPGRLAPKLVCVSVYDEGEARLLSASDGLDWFSAALESRDCRLVGHNVAFDVGVMVQARPSLMPLVWEAYDDDRIVCTKIAEQLRMIALGRFKIDPDTSRRPAFSLEASIRRHFGESVQGKGEDAWRMRYHELEDVPLEHWPREAVEYARKDAEYAWRLYQSQSSEGLSPDLMRQCRSDWSLHLISAWGLRTDPKAVDELEARLRASVESTVRELLEAGVYKETRTGTSKNMAEIRRRVSEAFNGAPPKTIKGAVRTDVTTLEQSGDPVLAKLASISNDQKLLTTYIPVLRAGTERPINPRYFMAESGRTTCRGPNVQNQPRKGGVRECYVPRDGYIYVACDYHVAELCSLAEVLVHQFGQSNMADALNAGRDLHLETAAGILGKSYEETCELHKAGDKAVKSARQMAKAMNFGLPGGLGARTFVDYASASYGVEITLEQAEELKSKWLRSYPEMQLYFDWVSEQIPLGGKFSAQQLYTGRVRAEVGYCDGCNTYFQGLTADGARRALYEVVRACYTAGDPLEGSRAVAFIHDEIILESPEGRATEAATRLSELMVRGMTRYLRSVKVKATPHLMRRWYKDAEPAYDERGALIPWEPTAS